ncbi:septum formation initiator family protein [Patescibacteria group bacterium]|nr:septum formation initiator family protein [Patescibacteria group bacterium]
MIKKITLGLTIIITAIIAYNLITQIIGAVKSGERLTQAADEVYKLEVENKALKKRLSQISSPQFMEEEIRNKLGLTKKGETLVVIPEEKLHSVMGASPSAQIRLPNWLGWLKVFFR